MVLIVGREDRRDLALAIGGIESVFHLIGGDAKRRGLVPVDHDVDLRILDLQVAGDVLQARQAAASSSRKSCEEL